MIPLAEPHAGRDVLWCVSGPTRLKSHPARLLFRVAPPSLMLPCTHVSNVEKNSLNQKFNTSADRLALFVPTSLSAFVHIPQVTAEDLSKSQQCHNGV